MGKIDSILRDMRKAGKVSDWKDKGNAGEQAVLQVCLELQRKIGGLIYHSYQYPYQSDTSGKIYTGNIKLENGKYVEYTESKRALEDEIDVLFVTDYRVFVIEVKSYHAKIEIYDHWLKKNGTEVDKSPILQTEKHCRHLYHAISYVLPDGNPNYIVPLCCFVDRCTVTDNRSPEFERYIPICILNNLKSSLMSLNTPLDYNLDLEEIKRKLNEKKSNCEESYL
mgnify:CR=1 FL=1